MMKHLTRREFLQAGALAAAGALLPGCRAMPRRVSPNEKLNIGIIGTGNRARGNIAGVESENIVALCDVDETFLAAMKEKFPRAKTHNDFRNLIEQKDIDAVVISTADHTHAVATAAALHAGKHVYCEKPLTHTVHEARAIAKLAVWHRELATQMGTQIHASSNYRRVVELVQSGAIGPVTECHVWCARTWSGGDRPKEMPPVPRTLHWDLWLGPASSRPYHPAYHPLNWRRWWDFGGGTLGDMGCHYIDLPFWALKLGAPRTIEALGPPLNPETTPAWLIVRYEFPARLNLPPVRLTWYDGGMQPELIGQGKVPPWKNGVLFVGEKGMLLADYSRRMLLPEAQFAGFQPPAPFIPNSIGHHQEWVRACKTGEPTTCNFAYGGVLTEAVLLGNVAYRTGHIIEWNGPLARVRNSRQAMNFVRSEYRKGWEL
jgi:predicted dehydrogenase